MNAAVLYGLVARDPNVRITQGGKSVASFTVVTTRMFQDKPFKDYVPCVAWGNTAQLVGNAVRAGTPVVIKGRISLRSYEQNGEKKWSTEVNVESLDVVGAQQQAQPPQQQFTNATGFSNGGGYNQAPAGFGQFGNAEEEIPF